LHRYTALRAEQSTQFSTWTDVARRFGLLSCC
jgi:hypothetical protein